MAGFGLRLGRSQGMEGYSGNLTEFNIDPTDTAAIFTGDMVAFGAGGFVAEATGAANNDDFTILGVFMGCRYQAADGSYEFKNQWDGGAGRSNCIAHVAVPPHGLFYIKGTSGQTYTQADIGTLKGVIYAAGSPQYGDSRVSLGAAGASVSTAPLIVHRVAPLPGNSIDIDEPVFEVSVARQQGFYTAA